MYEQNGAVIEQPAEGAAVQRSSPVVTFVLIAINVLVFLAMVLNGISAIDPTPREVIRWGGDFGPLTLNGEWWRMLTACFLHFGIIHLGMNMYILFQIGLFTEMLYGKVRFLLVYIAAGLGGNIASLYMHPTTASAGASGAIFGLYGALLGFLLIERGVVPRQAALQIAKSAGIFLAYNLIFGIADGRTDLSAHTGGLVTGFLAGCLLVRPRMGGPKRLPAAVAAALIVAALGLGISSLAAVAKKSGGNPAWTRQLYSEANVPFGAQGHVFYAGSATKADAENLARSLSAIGYVKDSGLTLVLSKGAEGPSISIPMGADEETYRRVHPLLSAQVDPKTGQLPAEIVADLYPWDDPGTVNGLEMVGILVAPTVGGPPLRLLVLNNKGELKKTIMIDTRQLMIGERDSIWYSGAAKEDEAAKLGKALQFYGFFRDDGTSVRLRKSSAGTEISYIVKPDAWNKPTTTTGFQTLTREIAPAVGGLPITIHFVDRHMQVQKDLVVR